jgi:threonyl-tRNA synthetase
MTQIELEFPDKTKRTYPSGTKPIDFIKNDIGPKLAEAALAVKLDDEFLDLTTPLHKGGKFKVLTFKDPEGKEVFRHSSSHIMAEAVLSLFPNAKPTIGPAVAEGFYYDFDSDKSFSPEDLLKIEAKMQEIIKNDEKFERKELTKDHALRIFKDNPYKVEMINELEDLKITAYTQGGFTDFCRGPHVPSTGKVKAIKLMKVAGAYWRADAKNKQLQRVYGVSFPDEKELKAYLTLMEEAEKRDHRKIGKELGLYSFHDEAPGMPFFHDKGTFIWQTLFNFVYDKMKKRNYEVNKTPMILNKSLWLQSGHWDHYKNNMYFTKIDEQDFAVKPMNCPGNILIFKTKSHSYRELPIRAGEFGLVHRHELSGVLSGLFRVRAFTQDDAHIFCTEEQIKSEVKDLITFTDEIYKTFGFSYHVELSTRPEKAMGRKELWDQAEKILKETIEEHTKTFKINEGEGAFYGPKIDFHLKDAIGRTWQCGTIQLDFQMPEKFDLTYEGSDGKKHRPVMLHRTILGSMERFMGILVEHYTGKFPLWLNPIQVRIITVADRFNEYAEKVKKQLEAHNLRVELDTRSESVSYKVRDAQLAKINYILVVGEKELADETVNVRTRDNNVLGVTMVAEFIAKCEQEVKDKK